MLYEVITELEGVIVRQFLSRRKHTHMDPSFAPHIFIECFFVTDPVRELVKQGYATYVPSNFGDIPQKIMQSDRVDLLVMTVSPMDKHGNLTFGLGCDYTPAAIEKARKIIVEVNPNMPRTRITSYNVCYTKLLRTLRPVSSPKIFRPSWTAAKAISQRVTNSPPSERSW